MSPRTRLLNTFLDSFSDEGLGFVHTVDQLFDNLPVALSDYAADKQAKTPVADLDTPLLQIHSYRISIYFTLSFPGWLSTSPKRHN